MTDERPPLLIDCDPGHDDVMALVLAHHLADVRGITTVAGNAPLEAVTRNALATVELLGVDTPVHSGAAAPLAGAPLHATHVHGASGLDGAQLPTPARPASGNDAAGFLLEASARTPGCWLVAIGPLTNVAMAIRRDPAIVERFAGISIMGGSAGAGNATAAAEFNVLADPEAADLVFRSGARIRMCGLNLTQQVRSSAPLMRRLRKAGSPRGTLLADLLAYLHTRMVELIGEPRASLHDPCAVLAAVQPDLFEFTPRPVAVELSGALTRGMTVVDERASQRQAASNVEVGYHVDQRAVLARLVDACR